MIRAASTIIFKEGVTKAQAAAALAQIAHLLDLPTEATVPVYAPMQQHRRGAKVVARFERRPYTIADAVHEFESDHGWPTFYVP